MYIYVYIYIERERERDIYIYIYINIYTHIHILSTRAGPQTPSAAHRASLARHTFTTHIVL